MKKNRSMIIIASAMTLLLSGCVSSLSGDSYSRSEARQAQFVQTGTVIGTRLVKIEGTKSGVGAITGGAVGGVAANSIGGGSGRVLATIAGAAVGALAGSAIEEGTTRNDGVEVTVRLDDSKATRAYVQEAKGTSFYNGQRVRITTTSSGTARVVPI
ncbi:glycine zipper 2TM domain-containing protein [Wohlfahrtiimonas larvae]|uniref:Glycine zipper 2TM domain-containing protein n=1 Tax=Wohlfahrtiimonas larvae TaxID=1157986 RepID=A0ABP9MP86_9GAMM|nr:glycine zipper 2TM domain-containing protein [Wohlfahrtiimonas larvae]